MWLEIIPSIQKLLPFLIIFLRNGLRFRVWGCRAIEFHWVEVVLVWWTSTYNSSCENGLDSYELCKHTVAIIVWINLLKLVALNSSWFPAPVLLFLEYPLLLLLWLALTKLKAHCGLWGRELCSVLQLSSWMAGWAEQICCEQPCRAVTAFGTAWEMKVACWAEEKWKTASLVWLQVVSSLPMFFLLYFKRTYTNLFWLSTVLFCACLSKRSTCLPSLGPCRQLVVTGSLIYKYPGNYSFESNLIPGKARHAKGRCLPVLPQFQYKLTQ